jgi:hypothetical protein
MQAVDEDCLLRASKLHEERKRPWRVCVRKGRSGCKDFWIEYLINTELKIIGKGGRLHISMNGKLNEGLDIPLMDLAPILHHQNFPEGWEQEHPEYSFEVISESDLPKIGDFYPAGTDEYGEEDIPVEEIQIKDEEE